MVSGVFDSVCYVIQRRRQIVDVFRIERGDEGLVETFEDFVNHLVAAVLEHRDFQSRYWPFWRCRHAPHRATTAMPRQ